MAKASATGSGAKSPPPRRFRVAVDEDGVRWRLIPSIGAALTRKKTSPSIGWKTRGQVRRWQTASSQWDLPIRRQRGWQTPARLDPLRLDSQLSALCSHSIKNSPPLSWPSDPLAYTAGGLSPPYLTRFPPPSAPRLIERRQWGWNS